MGVAYVVPTFDTFLNPLIQEVKLIQMGLIKSSK